MNQIKTYMSTNGLTQNFQTFLILPRQGRVTEIFWYFVCLFSSAAAASLWSSLAANKALDLEPPKPPTDSYPTVEAHNRQVRYLEELSYVVDTLPRH